MLYADLRLRFEYQKASESAAGSDVSCVSHVRVGGSVGDLELLQSLLNKSINSAPRFHDPSNLADGTLHMQ